MELRELAIIGLLMLETCGLSFSPQLLAVGAGPQKTVLSAEARAVPMAIPIAPLPYVLPVLASFRF